MLTGKFWIMPDGVVDVSTSEHALFAKKIMLGLAPEDYTYNVTTMFTPLSAAERRKFKGRGVCRRVLEFLSLHDNDPRMFAIREWKWIRTRQQSFHLWTFDAETISLIRNASTYWQVQRQVEPGDTIDVEQYGQASCFPVGLAKLLDQRCTAGSLSPRNARPYG